MSSLNQEENLYNEVPIIYCKSCLSLVIKNCLSDVTKYPSKEGEISEWDYCDSCGSTHLASCTISEYQELYKQRYGYYPLETF